MDTLRVVFISTEVAPFAKTGGLADVAGVLPKALSRLGVQVDIIMPPCGHIDQQAYELKKLTSDVRVEVPLGYYIEGVGVWQTNGRRTSSPEQRAVRHRQRHRLRCLESGDRSVDSRSLSSRRSIR